jgi:hypothetical protein
MAFTIPRLTPGGLLSVRLSPASPGAFPQITIRVIALLRWPPDSGASPCTRLSRDPQMGRYSHEYYHRSATSHAPGFGPSLARFPRGALPISGFVPTRALEDSARVSPGLLPALLGIPCKASRVPYEGLSNMVEVVIRCPSQPRSAAPSLGGGMARLAPRDLPACPCHACCRYPSPSWGPGQAAVLSGAVE